MPQLDVLQAWINPAQSFADPADWDWWLIPPVAPLTLTDGSRAARWQTIVRVCYDTEALYVRFECEDHDIWGTYTRRDEPIYEEEVVEVFLSPGPHTPAWYYEFEISPNGVLFDALIHNPNSRRDDLVVDVSWNCKGVRWSAERDDFAQHWRAMLVIPWAAIVPRPPPPVWRANFCRIERPHDAPPEFSCWSPTMTDPADFHKPAHFGVLRLAGLL